jgi:hypothetical protein
MHAFQAPKPSAAERGDLKHVLRFSRSDVHGALPAHGTASIESGRWRAARVCAPLVGAWDQVLCWSRVGPRREEEEEQEQGPLRLASAPAHQGDRRARP